MRNADPRAVALVTSTLLKWGYGEPPPYDPTKEKPVMRLDVSGLTLEERRMLLAAMDRATTVEAGEGDDTGPDFDPSRFEPEPLTIDATPAVDVSPQTSPTPATPSRKGRLNLF